MTKFIRVYYEHQTNPNVINTYIDFELDPNKEKVKFVELRLVIPENTKKIRKFK